MRPRVRRDDDAETRAGTRTDYASGEIFFIGRHAEIAANRKSAR